MSTKKPESEGKKGSPGGTKGGKKPQETWRQFGSQILSAVFILLIIAFAYNSFLSISGTEEIEVISLSQVAQRITAGEIASIEVDGNTLNIETVGEVKLESRKEPGGTLTEILATGYGITPAELRAVEIISKKPSGFASWGLPLLSIFAPILFILFIFWLLSRQVKGSTMQAFSFGQSKARMIDPNDKNQRVSFKDVAGAKEAKEELEEIVDFLKSPKKFLDIGAEIPKGVLLMGAPGTGKTLLARAVAGEAQVPFFYISGSEFVEMFVGVGASRVRDLFKMAKRAAPAIVFVDEIDAVGRQRGSGMGGGNDEREQTLNQILVEMDGFEPNQKVIVMAATNRPDVLDIALLRPGRFDRRVLIDLPDIKEREAILKIHAKKKKLHDDIDFNVISQRTPGFSGADLANIVNEGAILAARENRNKVTQHDVIRSAEKVMLGPERKSRIITAKEKKITAYHEAGHALVSSVLPYADPVHKVSIIARGHAGGYTLKLPLEEKRLRTKKEFLDDISMSLGAYAAEKLVFDDLTTGPSSDISTATALAREMVTRYGMSDVIGPQLIDSRGGMNYGMGLNPAPTSYSEEITAKIDSEVSRIITECLAVANKVLLDHRKALDSIAEELMKVEILERKEFEAILVRNGITPKTIDVSENITQKLMDEEVEEKAISN